jgi:hypothetical protein
LAGGFTGPGGWAGHRHYILTGGHSALKEPYNKLVSRLLLFPRFFIASDNATAKVSAPTAAQGGPLLPVAAAAVWLSFPHVGNAHRLCARAR